MGYGQKSTYVAVGNAENEKDGDDQKDTANEEPNNHQDISQQNEEPSRDATRDARPRPWNGQFCNFV